MRQCNIFTRMPKQFGEMPTNLQKCKTNLEPKTAKFDNYGIKLGKVTPYPASKVRIGASKRAAQIIVTKM